MDRFFSQLVVFFCCICRVNTRIFGNITTIHSSHPFSPTHKAHSVARTNLHARTAARNIVVPPWRAKKKKTKRIFPKLYSKINLTRTRLKRTKLIPETLIQPPHPPHTPAIRSGPMSAALIHNITTHKHHSTCAHIICGTLILFFRKHKICLHHRTHIPTTIIILCYSEHALCMRIRAWGFGHAFFCVCVVFNETRMRADVEQKKPTTWKW